VHTFENYRVTILRKWNNPTIYHLVNSDRIELSLPLEEFMDLVKKEIGSVAWTFTRRGFSKKVDKALFRVIEYIKRETVKRP